MTPLVKRLSVSSKSSLNLIALVSVTNINDVFRPWTYVVVVILLYGVLAFYTVLCEFVPFKIKVSGEHLNNIISFHFLVQDLLLIPLASVTSAFYMSETNFAINQLEMSSSSRTVITSCALAMTSLIVIGNAPIFLNNGPEDHVWNSYGIPTHPSYDYFQHVLLFVTAICLSSEASVVA